MKENNAQPRNIIILLYMVSLYSVIWEFANKGKFIGMVSKLTGKYVHKSEK